MIAIPTTTDREVATSRIHWVVFMWPFLVIVPIWVMLAVPALLAIGILQNALGQTPSLLYWVPIAVPLLPLAVLLVLAATAYQQTRYTLTERRLHFRIGFLLRASGELLVQDIEAILLVEPILGRLLGYGTVVVVGRGGTHFPLRFIPSPVTFHAALQGARDLARLGHPQRGDSLGSGDVRLSSPPLSRRSLDTQQPGPTSPNLEPTPPALGKLEKAWQELQRPRPEDPPDDSRYMPKS